MTNLVTRTILSAASIGAFSFAEKVFVNTTSTVSGEMAVSQFQNVDQPVHQALTQSLSGAYLSPTILAVSLGAIWYSPVKKWLGKASNTNLFGAALIASAATFANPIPAQAYYDTQDQPEFVEILPNQTAFAIPEQGANKSSQAAFMSEQYLSENKVAMKRFQVPHTIIRSPYLLSRDYYVPATKLLIIDRTPYMREWVADHNRGTSTKAEDFRLESADSVNIDVGVVISAAVAEENAAKFVYHFGAKPIDAVKANDPATTFASVIEARSLADVMDKNVRGKVQAVLAREFGRRTTEDCIRQKAEIMNTVEKEVRDAFVNDGITIEYIGFATALNFENSKIQDAIDQTIINQKMAQATAALAPSLPVLREQADIAVTNAKATAVSRWNGQLPALPSFMVVSSEISDLITGLIGKTPSKPVNQSNGTPALNALPAVK